MNTRPNLLLLALASLAVVSGCYSEQELSRLDADATVSDASSLPETEREDLASDPVDCFIALEDCLAEVDAIEHTLSGDAIESSYRSCHDEYATCAGESSCAAALDACVDSAQSGDPAELSDRLEACLDDHDACAS